MRRNNSNKLGQSMFELLVAVFVIGITLTALVSLVSTSLRNTGFSRERTTAGNYTQEAVEWLRRERDADWGTFTSRASASGTTYCLNALAWGENSCGSGTIPETPFTREVVLIYNSAADPNRVEARVTTTWTDSQGSHESSVNTYFTNWRTR